MEELSLHEYNQQKHTKKSAKRPRFDPKASMVVVAIVLLAVGFLGGMQYQKGKITTTTAAAANGQTAGRTGMAGGFGGAQRGDRAIGTVGNISSTSITIQTRRGTSNTYNITSSTTVTNNGTAAAISDIQAGDTVFVTLDSSNTKNASSIALNPSFGGGMGGQPSASSSENSGDQSTTDTSSI